MSQGSFAGSTVLVSGCRRGIGKAIALAFAGAGADIVGVSASLEPDGGAVGREVEGLGAAFAGHACDFGDRAAVYGLVEALRDGPPIDILVNNAGTIRRSPAAEHGDEDWDAVLEVNLSAQFVLTREIGKRMLERRGGKIVFIASLLSFQGGINVPGYAASKGGIAQLTKAFANEWASSGVNVNAVAPGYIATDNTQALQDDSIAVPLRSCSAFRPVAGARQAILPDAVLFLSSTAADYVHGVSSACRRWMAREMSEGDVSHALLSSRVIPVVVLEELETAVPVAAALAGWWPAGCRGHVPDGGRGGRDRAASPPRARSWSEPARSCGPSRSTRRSRRVRDSSSRPA